MGLVGLSFLANQHMSSIIMFTFVFVIFSVLGTGSIALGWALFTRAGFGASLSPKTVFRVSCIFTLSLGVLWIVCNYFDVLHMIDYTETATHHIDE